MLHDLELDFIRFLHQFRNPFFDQFFKFFDFFDRSEFFFLLIPIIWLGNGWKAGLRLFYIMFLSSVTNQALKALFLSPRPYHLDPNVGIIEVTGLGFPSGAAQTVILLSGILLTSWKSPWRWPVVFTYILLISFSRIYLGLHFPSDITAGWIVGAGLWAIYTYIFPVIETKLKKLQTISIFLLSQIIPLLLLTWQTSIAKSRICGAAMGIGIGLLIAYHYKWLLPPSKNKKEYLLRATIGILGTAVCYGLILRLPASDSILTNLFRYIFPGLWIALGSQWICGKIFYNGRKEN